MKNVLFCCVIFFYSLSYSQDINFPPFKDDYHIRNKEISKNVPLEENDFLISIFISHGMVNLTQIKHYVVNNGVLRKVYSENQSKYNKKLIMFKEESVDETHIQRIKSFSENSFLKKDNSFLNPPKTCIILDAETIGFIFTSKNKRSSYIIDGADYKLKNCPGFDKIALKEFISSFDSFEIDKNQYTSHFIRIKN